MASIDHTARSSHLVRNEPKSRSTSTVDVPLSPMSAERERQQACESKRAGTALAIAVMEGILKSHRAYQRVRRDGAKADLSPLNPVQLIGVEIGIDLLHHYVDTLTLARGG
jgi:hypothetical protein